ncbi:hypothetical protein ACLBWS_05290 [Brucellaceae bacterium D45D]
MIFTRNRNQQTQQFSNLLPIVEAQPAPRSTTDVSMQPIADPMQGWAQIADAAKDNMTQASKIKLGSLFGIGPRGLY